MTTLHWDNGSAYDFFVSLHILHRPADYGLRKAWAKGVRARLGQTERETLEQIMPMMTAPLHFLQTIDQPKDSATALASLAALAPAERVERLTLGHDTPPEVVARLHAIREQGSWEEDDVRLLLEGVPQHYSHRMKRQEITKTLTLWANADEFGDAFWHALNCYRKVFYAEEEERIQPLLAKAEARARQLADTLSLTDLIEELSQGVRVPDHLEADRLILVPSFWLTPLVLYGRLPQNSLIMLFGARPTEMSLVPGDIVPDALHQALKALADPTRLRILRYLSQQPMTPAQLARRLRLRAPTVSHHLYTLRLARLVHLSIEDGDKRRYALRPGAIETTYQNLSGFLSQTNED